MQPTEIARYFHYWGKAQKKEIETKGDPYHLLPYHCLDVAAVGWVLLSENTALTKNLAEFLELEEEAFIKLFVFCLALHDLGKFASAFQALFQDASGQLFSANPRWQYNGKEFRHDLLGLYFWHELRDLEELFPLSISDEEEPEIFQTFTVLMECTLGHHGKPIAATEPNKLKPYIEPKHNVPAATDFTRDLLGLLQPDIPFDKLRDKAWRHKLKQVSWLLAGVAVLADWLGSDQMHFPYLASAGSLQDYWHKAQQQARKAWQATALGNTGEVVPFQSIQAHFGFVSTPLQKWAEEVEIEQGPQLFILEDITGAGKTEAAQALTHRLMSAGLADGFYFGLPTMATSNAMYKRVLEHYPKLYAQGSVLPSIVLAHGARDMNEQFQATLAVEQGSDKDYSQDDETATAQCSQWLGDSRKKALLAPLGVGTIDQALLAVLPRRHQSLRLLGLHRKVLIFDEIHAADEYMFELLESLLSLHLHCGGSAILLTATLAKQQRQRLANIWLRETPHANMPLTQEHFPLATKVSLSADLDDTPLQETPLESREDVSRSVAVRFVDNLADVVAIVVSQAQSGNCVVWVRNSVEDAITAYNEICALLDNPDDALLFHSRFILDDRQRIEKTVINWLGKSSTGKERSGKVLISTQVFQESLDADTDMMISDICPIDDLIQRAGRLHRHTRNQQGAYESGVQDTRPDPVLYLHAPIWSDTPTANWLADSFRNTQVVYRSPGRLWLGMKILKELGGIHMPDKARDLIEAVYSEEAKVSIPEALVKAEDQTYSEERAKANKAKFNRLKWQEYGYSSESNPQWYEDDTDISARHSDVEVVNVLLLRREAQGELVPYVDHAKYAVPLSTLKLSKKKYADQLVTISEDEQTQLIQRYPSAKYLQPWVASEDTQFVYSDVVGFYGK